MYGDIFLQETQFFNIQKNPKTKLWSYGWELCPHPGIKENEYLFHTAYE